MEKVHIRIHPTIANGSGVPASIPPQSKGIKNRVSAGVSGGTTDKVLTMIIPSLTYTFKDLLQSILQQFPQYKQKYTNNDNYGYLGFRLYNAAQQEIPYDQGILLYQRGPKSIAIPSSSSSFESSRSSSSTTTTNLLLPSLHNGKVPVYHLVPSSVRIIPPPFIPSVRNTTAKNLTNDDDKKGLPFSLHRRSLVPSSTAVENVSSIPYQTNDSLTYTTTETTPLGSVAELLEKFTMDNMTNPILHTSNTSTRSSFGTVPSSKPTTVGPVKTQKESTIIKESNDNTVKSFPKTTESAHISTSSSSSSQILRIINPAQYDTSRSNPLLSLSDPLLFPNTASTMSMDRTPTELMNSLSRHTLLRLWYTVSQINLLYLSSVTKDTSNPSVAASLTMPRPVTIVPLIPSLISATAVSSATIHIYNRWMKAITKYNKDRIMKNGTSNEIITMADNSLFDIFSLYVPLEKIIDILNSLTVKPFTNNDLTYNTDSTNWISVSSIVSTLYRMALSIIFMSTSSIVTDSLVAVSVVNPDSVTAKILFDSTDNSKLVKKSIKLLPYLLEEFIHQLPQCYSVLHPHPSQFIPSSLIFNMNNTVRFSSPNVLALRTLPSWIVSSSWALDEQSPFFAILLNSIRRTVVPTVIHGTGAANDNDMYHWLDWISQWCSKAILEEHPDYVDGLVKLATAYSFEAGAGLLPKNTAPSVSKTTVSVPQVSFHRVMTLFFDMGIVKYFGLPLHIWIASFLLCSSTYREYRHSLKCLYEEKWFSDRQRTGEPNPFSSVIDKESVISKIILIHELENTTIPVSAIPQLFTYVCIAHASRILQSVLQPLSTAPNLQVLYEFLATVPSVSSPSLVPHKMDATPSGTDKSVVYNGILLRSILLSSLWSTMITTLRKTMMDTFHANRSGTLITTLLTVSSTLNTFSTLYAQHKHSLLNHGIHSSTSLLTNMYQNPFLQCSMACAVSSFATLAVRCGTQLIASALQKSRVQQLIKQRACETLPPPTYPHINKRIAMENIVSTMDEFISSGSDSVPIAESQWPSDHLFDGGRILTSLFHIARTCDVNGAILPVNSKSLSSTSYNTHYRKEMENTVKLLLRYAQEKLLFMHQPTVTEKSLVDTWMQTASLQMLKALPSSSSFSNTPNLSTDIVINYLDLYDYYQRQFQDVLTSNIGTSAIASSLNTLSTAYRVSSDSSNNPGTVPKVSVSPTFSDCDILYLSSSDDDDSEKYGKNKNSHSDESDNGSTRSFPSLGSSYLSDSNEDEEEEKKDYEGKPSVQLSISGRIIPSSVSMDSVILDVTDKHNPRISKGGIIMDGTISSSLQSVHSPGNFSELHGSTDNPSSVGHLSSPPGANSTVTTSSSPLIPPPRLPVSLPLTRYIGESVTLPIGTEPRVRILSGIDIEKLMKINEASATTIAAVRRGLLLSSHGRRQQLFNNLQGPFSSNGVPFSLPNINNSNNNSSRNPWSSYGNLHQSFMFASHTVSKKGQYFPERILERYGLQGTSHGISILEYAMELLRNQNEEFDIPFDSMEDEDENTFDPVQASTKANLSSPDGQHKSGLLSTDNAKGNGSIEKSLTKKDNESKHAEHYGRDRTAAVDTSELEIDIDAVFSSGAEDNDDDTGSNKRRASKVHNRQSIKSVTPHSNLTQTDRDKIIGSETSVNNTRSVVPEPPVATNAATFTNPLVPPIRKPSTVHQLREQRKQNALLWHDPVKALEKLDRILQSLEKARKTLYDTVKYSYVWDLPENILKKDLYTDFADTNDTLLPLGIVAGSVNIYVHTHIRFAPTVKFNQATITKPEFVSPTDTTISQISSNYSPAVTVHSTNLFSGMKHRIHVSQGSSTTHGTQLTHFTGITDSPSETTESFHHSRNQSAFSDSSGTKVVHNPNHDVTKDRNNTVHFERKPHISTSTAAVSVNESLSSSSSSMLSPAFPITSLSPLGLTSPTQSNHLIAPPGNTVPKGRNTGLPYASFATFQSFEEVSPVSTGSKPLSLAFWDGQTGLLPVSAIQLPLSNSSSTIASARNPENKPKKNKSNALSKDPRRSTSPSERSPSPLHSNTATDLLSKLASLPTVSPAVVRSTIAWAEYHHALLAITEADVLLEALTLRSTMEEKRYREAVNNSSNTIDTSSIPSVKQNILHAQISMPVTSLDIDSFRSLAGEIDNLLSLALRSLDKCFALRLPWPLALQTFSRTLVRRSMLTYPIVLAGKSEYVSKVPISLPLPVPSNLLQEVSNGSTDQTNANFTETSIPTDTIPTENSISSSVQVLTESKRWVTAFYHPKPTAVRMLHAASIATEQIVTLEQQEENKQREVNKDTEELSDPTNIAVLETLMHNRQNAEEGNKAVQMMIVLRGMILNDIPLLPVPSPSALSAMVTNLGTTLKESKTENIIEQIVKHQVSSIRIITSGMYHAKPAFHKITAPVIPTFPKTVYQEDIHWNNRIVLPSYMPTFIQDIIGLSSKSMAAKLLTNESKEESITDPFVSTLHQQLQSTSSITGFTSLGTILLYRLFSFLDKDCDGLLTGAEVVRMWALLSPLIEKEPVWTEWLHDIEDKLDHSNDSTVPKNLRRTSSVSLNNFHRPTRPAERAVQRSALLYSLLLWFNQHFSTSYLASSRDTTSRAEPDISNMIGTHKLDVQSTEKPKRKKKTSSVYLRSSPTVVNSTSGNNPLLLQVIKSSSSSSSSTSESMDEHVDSKETQDSIPDKMESILPIDPDTLYAHLSSDTESGLPSPPTHKDRKPTVVTNEDEEPLVPLQSSSSTQLLPLGINSIDILPSMNAEPIEGFVPPAIDEPNMEQSDTTNRQSKKKWSKRTPTRSKKQDKGSKVRNIVSKSKVSYDPPITISVWESQPAYRLADISERYGITADSVEDKNMDTKENETLPKVIPPRTHTIKSFYYSKKRETFHRAYYLFAAGAVQPSILRRKKKRIISERQVTGSGTDQVPGTTSNADSPSKQNPSIVPNSKRKKQLLLGLPRVLRSLVPKKINKSKYPDNSLVASSSSSSAVSSSASSSASPIPNNVQGNPFLQEKSFTLPQTKASLYRRVRYQRIPCRTHRYRKVNHYRRQLCTRVPTVTRRSEVTFTSVAEMGITFCTFLEFCSWLIIQDPFKLFNVLIQNGMISTREIMERVFTDLAATTNKPTTTRPEFSPSQYNTSEADFLSPKSSLYNGVYFPEEILPSWTSSIDVGIVLRKQPLRLIQATTEKYQMTNTFLGTPNRLHTVDNDKDDHFSVSSASTFELWEDNDQWNEVNDINNEPVGIRRSSIVSTSTLETLSSDGTETVTSTDTEILEGLMTDDNYYFNDDFQSWNGNNNEISISMDAHGDNNHLSSSSSSPDISSTSPSSSSSSSPSTGKDRTTDDETHRQNMPRAYVTRSRIRSSRRRRKTRSQENDQSETSTSTSTSRSRRSNRSTPQNADKYEYTRHMLRNISTNNLSNPSALHRQSMGNSNSLGWNSNILIHAGVYPVLSPTNVRMSVTVPNRWTLPSSASSNNLQVNDANRSRSDTNVSNSLIPRTVSRSNRAVSESLGLSLDDTTINNLINEGNTVDVGKSGSQYDDGRGKRRRYVTKGMKRRYQLLYNDQLMLANTANYRPYVASNGPVSAPSSNPGDSNSNAVNVGNNASLVHSMSTFNLTTSVPLPPSLRITQPTLRASPPSTGTPRSSIRQRPRMPSSDVKGDSLPGNGRSRAGTQTTLSYISTPSRRQSLAATLSGVYPSVNNPLGTPLPSMTGGSSFQNLNNLLPPSTVSNRYMGRLRTSSNVNGIGSLNSSLGGYGGLPTVSGGLTDTMNTNIVRTPINRRNSVARRTLGNNNPIGRLDNVGINNSMMSPTVQTRTLLHQAWNIETLNWNDLISVMGYMYVKYPPLVPFNYVDIDYSRYLEDDDDGIIDHSLISNEELEPYQDSSTIPLGVDFPTKTVVGSHLLECDAEWLRQQIRNTPQNSTSITTANTSGKKGNALNDTAKSTDLSITKVPGANSMILSSLRPPTLDENVSLRISNMVNHIISSRSLFFQQQGSLLHTILLQQYLQAVRRYRLNGCTMTAAQAARKPGGPRLAYAPIANIAGHGIPRRLFEYYVVVGRGDILPDIDIPSTVDVDDLEFSPVIYERFPGEDWSGGKTLPSNIGIFAFPFGIRIGKDTAPASSTFDFVLTSEDGAKLFCTCIIRWELMDALDAVSMFAVGSSNTGTNGTAMNMNTMLNTINKHSLLLPNWFDLSTVADPNWNKKYSYYSPKAHILMSSQPIFGAMHTTLTQLVRLTLASSTVNSNNGAGNPKSTVNTENSSALLPMEAYISYILHDIPLPPRGFASVGFTLGDRHIIVSRPPINQLPLLDVPLETLFQCLDINNILLVFTALLCERRIALCSKYVHLLTPVAEALVSLLFPFRWVVNYIPVLPFDMAEIIGAPTPYLLGWCGTVEEAQAYSAETVFVGLDTNMVHVPSFTPLPKLPEVSRRKLVRALQMYAYGSTGGITNNVSRGGVFASLGFTNANSSSTGPTNRTNTASSNANAGTTNASSSNTVSTIQIAYGADMNNDLQNRVQTLTVLPNVPSTVENKHALGIGNNFSPLVPLSIFMNNDAHQQKKAGVVTTNAGTAPTTLTPMLYPGSINFRMATPLWSQLRTSHLFTGSIDLHRLASIASVNFQNNTVLANQLSSIAKPNANDRGDNTVTNLFPFAFGWIWKYDMNQLSVLNTHTMNTLLDDERGTSTITATASSTTNQYSSGGSGDEGAANNRSKNTKGTVASASSNNVTGKTAPNSPTTPPNPNSSSPILIDMDITMEHGIPWDPSNTLGSSATGSDKSSSNVVSSGNPNTITNDNSSASDYSVTNTVTGLSNRFDAAGIRLSFLSFFVTLLKDYNKYVTYTKINTQPPNVTAIHLHRMVTATRRQQIFANSTGNPNTSLSVNNPKTVSNTAVNSGNSSTSFPMTFDYLNTSTTVSTYANDTITATALPLLGTPLSIAQISPLETTIDTMKRIGIPIPPLPLPLLSVAFDKDSFILEHSASRDICRQFMSTQLFQVFEQSLLPLCYRPSSLTQLGTQYSNSSTGSSTQQQQGNTATNLSLLPTIWNPDEQDSYFYQRLTPSVRLFNTAVNAKLNQTAVTSRLTFTRSTNKVRFDTSFLTDTTMLIKHHIMISPPVPLIAPMELSLALTTLRQAPETTMDNSMDKMGYPNTNSLVSPTLGITVPSSTTSPAILQNARAPQSGIRLYTSPITNTTMNNNNPSSALPNLLATPSRRRGLSSSVSVPYSSSTSSNNLLTSTQPNSVTNGNYNSNDNGNYNSNAPPPPPIQTNDRSNSKVIVRHRGGRHRYLAQLQRK